MNCYDSEILSHYQDGSLGEAESRRIAGHLESCAECREKLRALGHAGLFLRIALGSRKSAECPADEELGAYLSGRMRAEDRRRIEDHLLACRQCLHEVAVLSDDAALSPAADSPAPDEKALARFRRLAEIGQRNGDSLPVGVKETVTVSLPVSRRAFAFAGTWGLRAAAAALLAAVAFGWVMSPEPSERPAPTAGPDLRAIGGGYLAEVSMGADSALMPGGNAELGRFAREAGLVLREIERIHERPRADSFELVQEDILNSGLVESVSRLGESVRESRDRKFLADCEYILMQVVKADSSNLAGESGDLARIVSEIRRLNLIETARLVEMEGGRSQWLAGL